ncbi:unnamed protein product [Echinostoma caproni]|uniref:Endo/exonuclease/phosphatase domain-containing protein n=1 Tax=Echinostoma caproni TaxID=27848 RepID=A0A183ANV4_9TREM|nr:unnamed protein product [Echinostoma caproni]
MANEDDALLLTLRTAARHNGKLPILGDFNTPEINWSEESAPSLSFGFAILNLLQDEVLSQHVREDTRWRDGSRPLRLDLVLTTGANDLGSIQIMAPMGESNHALLHITMSLRGSTAPDKERRNYGGMNLAQLLSGANDMTWEMDPSEPLDDSWNPVESNLLHLSNTYAPLRKIRRNRKPPWWKVRAQKAQTRNERAWVRLMASGSHRRFLEYDRMRKRAMAVKRVYRVAYEGKLVRNAKLNPEAYFNYVQSKATIKGAVGNVQNEDGISVESSAEKVGILRRYFERVHQTDKGVNPQTL